MRLFANSFTLLKVGDILTMFGSIHAHIKPEYVIKSHEECRSWKMNPILIPTFVQLTNMEMYRKKVQYADILNIVNEGIGELAHSLKDTVPVLFAVCDNEACILQIDGDSSMQQVMDSIGLKKGVKFTSCDTGTNVVNLALEYGTSIKLIGDDHYHHILHTAACYGVPIRYLSTQKVLGVICVMTDVGMDNPFLLPLLEATISSIEREIMLLDRNNQLNLFNAVLMESNQNGILITDPNGEIQQMNKAFLSFLNDIQFELATSNSFDFPKIGFYFQDVITHGHPHTNVSFIVTHNKIDRHIIAEFYPVFDQQYQLIAAVGQFREMQKT